MLLFYLAFLLVETLVGHSGAGASGWGRSATLGIFGGGGADVWELMKPGEPVPAAAAAAVARRLGTTPRGLADATVSTDDLATTDVNCTATSQCGNGVCPNTTVGYSFCQCNPGWTTLKLTEEQLAQLETGELDTCGYAQLSKTLLLVLSIFFGGCGEIFCSYSLV